MKVKKLFVAHEGLFHPICDVKEFPKLLKIESNQMADVFGHFCKFGTSGKIFGGVIPTTKENLVEAQKKLNEVRLQNKTKRASAEWLEAKKAEKRVKFGIEN